MLTGLFDTHAHYDARQFDPDRDQVLSALPGQGVELVVDPGCDLASSRKAVELAGRWPFVYASSTSPSFQSPQSSGWTPTAAYTKGHRPASSRQAVELADRKSVG